MNNEGLEDWIVRVALEREIKSAKNANIEVDSRTANNRILYLLEHQYHANIRLKALEEFSIEEFNNVYLRNQLYG